MPRLRHSGDGSGRYRRHRLERSTSRRAESRAEAQRAAAAASCWSDEIDPFLGESARVRHLSQVAERVLSSEDPVLICGETGSGKGVLARWLHDHGPRGGEAFVDVGCAGLDPGALEAELFGYETAVTGGLTATKAGLFEIAHHGTVFLDEVGELPFEIQTRLCAVLAEGRVKRRGDERSRPVDVRVVTATHDDLSRVISRFHPQLWERLLTLEIPPLRERPEDIPHLATSILRRLAAESAEPLALSGPALVRLKRHPWPGNIRELKNVLERAVLLGGAVELAPHDLQFDTLEPVVQRG